MIVLDNGYRIGELAEKAGVTKRTVHYYIAKGLIPPPEGSGINSTYNDGHLIRIRLVKKLQDNFLPLGRIKEILNGLGDSEVIAELESDYGINIEAGNIDGLNDYNTGCKKGLCGMAYVRTILAPGLELHYSLDKQHDYADIIDNIKRYAEKLFEER